ncbi:MAG: prenyltransferase [Planctomycetales bacterium]|nr:prenyltransferase [Planctomycetales bacterium]
MKFISRSSTQHSGVTRRDAMKIGCTHLTALSSVSFGLPAATVQAQPNSGRPQSHITPAAQQSIDSGLEYLAGLQREEGSFGASDFSRNVGVVSLAGIAWLCHGSTPLRGIYASNTRRCLSYLLDNVRNDGFIRTAGAADRRPMYGHGFGTTFLCLTHGMNAHSATNRARIKLAVEVIVNSQNEDGGWRYEPRRNDADISVTACQMTALRAAKNAGFYVPNKTISAATEYIQGCQNPDGGFAYQRNSGESEFARSAAAVVAIYGAGIYDGKSIEDALSYLITTANDRGYSENHEYFYYGILYAAQAMWQAGQDYWDQWFPKTRDLLIRLQKKEDGRWVDPVGPAYATAVALIVLQMENRYVPLFQK